MRSSLAATTASVGGPPPQARWPAFARVPLACELSGLSRSGLYRELGAGNIRAVKHNSSTLVDMSSVREFLDTLPAATIRAAL